MKETEAPALQFDNVWFAYQRDWVLQNIHFSVARRETACIVGPNGGGKSTLLKLALGLIEPGRGSVRVLGQSPQRARLRIGYMPQYFQFDPQFPISVREIIAMGRLQAGRLRSNARADRITIDRVLDEVGLREAANKAFSELSGGQKQRALIARALAVDPEILLLDEPTAMVDSHIEAKLLKTLKELHQKLTIVLVSHDAAFVSELVDTVICVNREAAIHPTERVRDGSIHTLYGERVRSVQHSHDLHEHE